ILALQLWAHGDRHTRRFALTAFLAAFVLVGGIYPLYAALKGELLPGAGHVSLLGAVHFQLAGRAGTGSPLRPGTIGHATVAGWRSSSPVRPGRTAWRRHGRWTERARSGRPSAGSRQTCRGPPAC